MSQNDCPMITNVNGFIVNNDQNFFFYSLQKKLKFLFAYFKTALCSLFSHTENIQMIAHFISDIMNALCMTLV